MAKYWHYYDERGTKCGPVHSSALRALAAQGVVQPDTTLETESGQQAPASRIEGLAFGGSTAGNDFALHDASQTSFAPPIHPVLQGQQGNPQGKPSPTGAILWAVLFPPVGLGKVGAYYGKPSTARTLTLVWLVIWSISVLNGIANSNPESRSGSTGGGTRPGISAQERETEKRQEMEAAPEVDANTLVREFDGNEVRANRNYKGEWIRVSGSIDNIGTDILGKPYVSLDTTHPIRSVQCFFSRGEKGEGQIADLRSGQWVTIYGKCGGLMMNVLLEDCSIVE